jgi:hypothetical protein
MRFVESRRFPSWALITVVPALFPLAAPSPLIVATVGTLDCHVTPDTARDDPSSYKPVTRNATLPDAPITAARGVIVIEDNLAASPLVLLQPTTTAARAATRGTRTILRRPLPALRKNGDRLP